MGTQGWWAGCLSGLWWIVPLLFFVCMGGMMYLMFARGGCMGMRHGSADRPDARRDTPGEVLDRRFARGEISPEQYAEMKRDLEAPSGGTL
jgi:putative membrane protein